MWTCFQFTWVNTWEWNCWVTVTLFWTFWGVPDCFPKKLHHFTFPPAMSEGSNSPHPHQHLLLSILLITALLVGCGSFYNKKQQLKQYCGQAHSLINQRTQSTTGSRLGDQTDTPAVSVPVVPWQGQWLSLPWGPVRNAKFWTLSQTFRVRNSGVPVIPVILPLHVSSNHLIRDD